MTGRKVSNTSIRLRTHCGNLFVNINTNKKGKPLRIVDASLGPAGKCKDTLFQTIAELITLCLEHKIPIEEIISKLRGHHCPRPMLGRKGFQSCVDGIGKELEELFDQESA